MKEKVSTSTVNSNRTYNQELSSKKISLDYIKTIKQARQVLLYAKLMFVKKISFNDFEKYDFSTKSNFKKAFNKLPEHESFIIEKDRIRVPYNYEIDFEDGEKFISYMYEDLDQDLTDILKLILWFLRGHDKYNTGNKLTKSKKHHLLLDNVYIAKELGISRSSVKIAIPELGRLGLIDIESYNKVVKDSDEKRKVLIIREISINYVDDNIKELLDLYHNDKDMLEKIERKEKIRQYKMKNKFVVKTTKAGPPKGYIEANDDDDDWDMCDIGLTMEDY